MTPEEYKEAAISARDRGKLEEAHFYVKMGILEALLQMEVCGHGVRGYCIDCFWLRFQQNLPIITKLWR